MFVQLTQITYIPAAALGFAAGVILEIPPEYYNSATMTRIGAPLTTAQRFACVTWASLCPGWPLINQE